MSTKLQRAIERGLRPEGDLANEIEGLGDYEVSSRDDALAICAALQQIPGDRPEDDPSLNALSGLFQNVPDVESDAFEVLSEQGTAELLRLVEVLEDRAESSDVVLFLLKILAMYGSEEGTAKVVELARAGYCDDNFLWTVILGQFTAEHPGTPQMLEMLASPLPKKFLEIALLDMANQVAIHGDEVVAPHPFDSEEGIERLFSWLRDSDPENFSFAHSATATLPFIRNPQRDQLLALAMDHPDPGVQMEGAWASGKLGSESALKFLARFCLDPNHSSTACAYLRELNRTDQIPAAAREPDFEAMAEMCSWLAHPQEFGRPPDAIEIADSRELFWPPTDDHRWLWLFKYRYDNSAGDDEDEPEPKIDEGYGLVGSSTFALFGETTADLSPEDVYALHCCWELEMNEDQRAPEERSIAAGRAILAAENEGF